MGLTIRAKGPCIPFWNNWCCNQDKTIVDLLLNFRAHFQNLYGVIYIYMNRLVDMPYLLDTLLKGQRSDYIYIGTESVVAIVCLDLLWCICRSS